MKKAKVLDNIFILYYDFHKITTYKNLHKKPHRKLLSAQGEIYFFPFVIFYELYSLILIIYIFLLTVKIN